MTRLRSRFLALSAVSLFAFTLFAAPAASADTTTPGAYHAKATATALDLNVFGNEITLGFTHAENASDPLAAAHAIGALVPGVGNQSDQTANADSTSLTNALPEVCGPITLPDSFPVVDLATACSSVSAAIANGFPTSDSQASVANIDVNANQVLGTVSGPVNQALGGLIDGLQPVLQAVDQTGIDSQSLLNELIAAITENGDLVRIELGPSQSTSSAASATETAAAVAQGAVIDVLPRDLLELPPVLKIEVGAASNTINVDRTVGTATVDYAPSIVKITVANDIADALGLTPDQRVQQIAPGVNQCFLPAPLTSCITIAGGSTSVDENGVTHGQADGVALQLLTGVQNGVALRLASTSVEGVGALEATREAPPAVEPPLARTGGTGDTMLGAGLLVAAIGGMMLVRSSRRRSAVI